MEKTKSMTENEKYLLLALLNLVKFLSNFNVSPLENVVYKDGSNPRTDYSIPKVPIGG